MMLKMIVKWFLGRHRFRIKFNASIGWVLDDTMSSCRGTCFNRDPYIYFYEQSNRVHNLGPRNSNC